MPSNRLTRLKRLRLKLEIDQPAEYSGRSANSQGKRFAKPRVRVAHDLCSPSKLGLGSGRVARRGQRD